MKTFEKSECEPQTGLILMSIEDYNSEGVEFIKDLFATNKLARLVFDECHLLLSSQTYIPLMEHWFRIRDFPCQLIFISATLPPKMEVELKEKN